LFFVTVVVAVIQLVCYPFLLESPRWLLSRDPESLEARQIIKNLRGLQLDHELERELSHYILGEAAKQHDSTKSSTAILSEILAHRKLRTLLASCLILQMAQQLCGINAVFYYSTSFFEGVIDNPLVGTTIVSAVNVVATYVALLLMDTCGRRSLILWSSGGMFLSCIVIVAALLGYFDKFLALVAVNVYVSFFEIGLGPIPWLIVAETFDAKYVAVAMSVCSQLNWVCDFIIGLIFPSMKVHLGSYSFLPFAVVLACTFMFALLVLPETQGTTPEELMAEMARRNSKSIVYEANNKNNNTTEQTTIGALDGEWRDVMKQLIEEEQMQMADGTYGKFQLMASHEQNF
jgi:MFS transporter, SP family, solute carrier family 2 (facilitated glucose transporter), member 3